MSLPTLKLLGHEIAKSDWNPLNRNVFWAACVIAFFGSFRMGEILAANKNSFTPNETLLWEDVTLGKDIVTFHIKIPKSRASKGEYIDLFQFQGHNCCPHECMTILAKHKTSDRGPDFRFESGNLLTVVNFSSTVKKKLLKPHLGDKEDWFAAHSFRAGIPSALAANPEYAREEEIKSWGRWNSASYLLYTRLKNEQKRAIFRKITNVLS